ncbi:hypothetical protein [Bacillus wiedmannii]|uniref:hypothetical protein n=1 Tax=Bacillus wiedmannii TaxID=1890302 RepID=UPI00352AC379
MSHDKVLEASVVAVPHEKRPVYLHCTKKGTSSRKRRSVCFTKSRISENICREILKESAA